MCKHMVEKAAFKDAKKRDLIPFPKNKDIKRWQILPFEQSLERDGNLVDCRARRQNSKAKDVVNCVFIFRKWYY